MSSVRQTLAVILAIGIPARVRGQQDTLALVRQRAGCYALTLGQWSRPPLAEEGWPEAQNPPPVFRLDTIPVKLGASRRFAVEPAQLVAGRMAASWVLLPNCSISMFWSTGYVGVRLRFAARGDSLVGVATTFHDAHYPGEPPDPSASAIATRTVCSP